MNFLLSAIVAIIQHYKGDVPLSVYLKDYFRQHPKLGARDRRAVSEAVYIYYRCASFLYPESTVLEVIRQGLAMCKSENKFLKDTFDRFGLPVATTHDASIAIQSLSGKFTNALSAGLSTFEWIQSMLHQRDLFIRIRRNREEVFKKLEKANLAYSVLNTNLLGDADREFYEQRGTCIALQNGSNLNPNLMPADYVVQDWASQASMAVVAKYVTDYKQQHKTQADFFVWDVCAGAGGKSIFWKDKNPTDQLWTTDIRRKILKNLEQRFSGYGLAGFKTLLLDATSRTELKQKLGTQQFDFMVCDVPCSGSGTWGRTPEQFYFFRNDHLAKFETLQYPIAFEAHHFLKAGGLLAYITCSVFKAENEAVVEKLLHNTNLKLLHQQLINGISHQADTLFVAVFQKE